MELLSLLFMSSCFLTLSGLTFGDQSGGPVIVREGDDAILPCSLGSSIEFVRFEWTKEGTEKKVYIHDTGEGYSPALPGRVSHFRDDLQHGNASIKINHVQLEDGGIYTCNFPTRGKTFRIELVVEPILKVRNVPGAAELYITILDQRNGGMLLQCDVQSGLPKPTVEWRDSNNQIIPSEEPQVSEQGGRFHITLKATVEKNDRYHCVATQKEIKHQVQKEINVHFDEPNTGWKIVAGVAVAVVLAVVLALVVFWILLRHYIKNKKKTNKESSEPSAQELKPNADQSV